MLMPLKTTANPSRVNTYTIMRNALYFPNINNKKGLFGLKSDIVLQKSVANSFTVWLHGRGLDSSICFCMQWIVACYLVWPT